MISLGRINSFTPSNFFVYLNISKFLCKKGGRTLSWLLLTESNFFIQNTPCIYIEFHMQSKLYLWLKQCLIQLLTTMSIFHRPTKDKKVQLHNCIMGNFVLVETDVQITWKDHAVNSTFWFSTYFHKPILLQYYWKKLSKLRMYFLVWDFKNLSSCLFWYSRTRRKDH